MLRPGRDKPNPYFSYKAREESGADGVKRHVDKRALSLFTLRLFEIACLLLCVDYVASFIKNANHSIVRAAKKLGVADCVANCKDAEMKSGRGWRSRAHCLRHHFFPGP
jgi:hypothetical protein